MEGAFRFKSWFLNAPGLIHSEAYYRNFTVVIRARGATLKVGGGG